MILRMGMFSLLLSLGVGLTMSSASTSSPITLKTVEQVCLNPQNDLHLDAYVFYGGYLFCNTSDEYTGGQQLYKQQSNGKLVFVRGGGGMYRSSDLVKLARVPQATANYLVTTMNQKLAALPHPTPAPSPAPTGTPTPIACQTPVAGHPVQNPCGGGN
jgi:hypothetical protein